MTLRGNIFGGSGIFRSAIFGGAGGAAPAGNGLLNNLIAYWPGNELNGNALDLHTNALHLTDVNTVTSAAGVVYPLARQYTAANTEHHRRPGDDALLSTGDVDFTIAAWCNADSLGAGTYPGIATKHDGNREYMLFYHVPNGAFCILVSPNGVAAVELFSTAGAAVTGAWYFVVGWHDSVANTINIQVNNGAVDSMAHATGVWDDTNRFCIGAWQITAGYTSRRWDGRIGPTMFWKSNAGLGGVLTAAQRTALFNAGAGLPYASFTL